MRILFLRVMLGWWMVPFIWTLIWVIAYLMVGDKQEVNGMCSHLTHMLWNGIEKDD